MLILPRPAHFPRVSMSLGFRMDRSKAGRKEPLDIVVAVRNDSSSNMTALKIQLTQECRWSAKGQHDKMTRVIASMVVPGSQLGKMKSTPGIGSDGGQSVAPVEANPRTDLMQKLAAGSGLRFQLVVPGNCHLSLQTTNISVTHSVGVMLVTTGCMAAPCVWAPLSVVAWSASTGPVVPLPLATSAVTQQILPALPRHTVPSQTLPNLPRQMVQYLAGPYGSAPTAPTAPPYPHDNPPSVTTYGSAQSVPYQQKSPPPCTTNGSAPGFVPDGQYPSRQPMPYATAVEMDAHGNVTPGL